MISSAGSATAAPSQRSRFSRLEVKSRMPVAGAKWRKRSSARITAVEQ
jgi:hypothetical protein